MPEPKPTDRNDNNRPTTALEIELAKHIVRACVDTYGLRMGYAHQPPARRTFQLAPGRHAVYAPPYVRVPVSGTPEHWYVRT